MTTDQAIEEMKLILLNPNISDKDRLYAINMLSDIKATINGMVDKESSSQSKE